MPAVCKFPPLVPPLAGESIQSPVFFRSPNVEKRIALLPSAYRNLECTARRFGHVRQPTYVTHDCYKNAVEDLTAIMQNLLTRAAPLPWGGTHEAAPACPYTSTAVQANSYRCLKHSPASVGQKFCICTISTFPEPKALPIKGNKDFDPFGRSSGAGTANWRLSSDACRS